MIFGHDRLDWLRKNSDQEIVRFCLEILRKSYPEITECLESFVTRWMDDPFSLGSYSSMVIGSSLDDIRSLSKPLFSNRLYLVGEYTSISSLGYAHGAVISGIKAADHILSQNTK
jgi:monoamine oxidase